MQPSEPSTATLSSDLHALCLDLHRNPYPHVPNPSNCKKRASVALIIRIRPRHPEIPPEDSTYPLIPTEARLDAFFGRDWVQRGDPEVLFIKRAARRGDRFTSHVAFPGGKRDPADASDRDAAIRETQEEVGLDLTSAIQVGNMAERVIMSEWNAMTPLMVLCPFVFVVESPALPALRPQPSEVHGAHWVPLRVLLDPALKTWERTDVSDRLPRVGGKSKKIGFRLLLGQMMYVATYLVPSVSVFASEGAGFLPPAAPAAPSSFMGKASSALSSLLLADHSNSPDPQRALRLWGLTHGIVADFLDILPNHDATNMWEWPTFSAPDVRFVIWLLSRRFRAERFRNIRMGSNGPVTSTVDDTGTPVQRAIQGERGRESAFWSVMKDYFAIMRLAVYVTLSLRVGALGILSAVLYRRWRLRALK